MALYNYDIYNVIWDEWNFTEYDTEWGGGDRFSFDWEVTYSGYTRSPTLNTTTGALTNNGTYETYKGTGRDLYRSHGPTLGSRYQSSSYYRKRISIGGGGTTKHTQEQRFEWMRYASMGSKRGSVVAEDGTYERNGLEDYKTWYVRRAILVPSPPSTITVPNNIKGGEKLVVSWSSSTHVTNYRLERSLNGGVWTQVYSGSARNHIDTVPKGTLTVSYRVRVYGNGQYSAYRTSSALTVKNFPEMGLKVNNQLKMGEQGWVKVNGQLRNIDTMWIKTNEVLREV